MDDKFILRFELMAMQVEALQHALNILATGFSTIHPDLRDQFGTAVDTIIEREPDISVGVQSIIYELLGEDRP
ncbi:MAG: hypothetical protein JKX72_09420 [Robiginitomaculum sp.]|nr:hypothetical protein [Robiginitomaculum sp.]